MKKVFAVLFCMMMSLSFFTLVGCGSNDAEEATEATEAVSEEVTEAVTEATEAATDDIGIDKATEIALADAGLSADAVEFTKQSPDIDDGVNIYEVEFINGEVKYEYDIAAKTGSIRDKDTDSVYDD